VEAQFFLVDADFYPISYSMLYALALQSILLPVHVRPIHLGVTFATERLGSKFVPCDVVIFLLIKSGEAKLHCAALCSMNHITHTKFKDADLTPHPNKKNNNNNKIKIK
jgi:hypothetical protein